MKWYICHQRLHFIPTLHVFILGLRRRKLQVPDKDQGAKDCVRIILNRVKYVGINGIIVLPFVDHKVAILDYL